MVGEFLVNIPVYDRLTHAIRIGKVSQVEFRDEVFHQIDWDG